MDIATLIGFVLAFGLIVVSILLGGSLMLFVDVPSVLIVFGGTLGAGLINFPLGQLLGALKIARHAVFHRPEDPAARIKLMIDFSSKARREGVLSLEGELSKVSDPFMITGLQLVIDGQETEAIEAILSTEIDALRERHREGASIFTTLAAFAPALGLIGTLIGLVQMLQNMDDPSSIGPAMAVALLTTFYGAVIANLICTPIAGKLKTRSGQEAMLREMTLEGVLAIASGDNPRLVEQKLNAFLPRSRRGAEGA